MIKHAAKALAVAGVVTLATPGLAAAHSMSAMSSMGDMNHDMSASHMPMDYPAAADMSGMPMMYTADLAPLNGSGAHGLVYIVMKDGKAKVTTYTKGLSLGLPHAQHIHYGAAGTCPDMSADKNKDGFVDVAEASPNYGPIQVSLTTEGDSSPASGLAVDRFPVTGPDGMTGYSRTVDLPAGATAANLENAVIVQHGISSLFDNQAMYDGSKPSEIAPALPFEATVPADCGALTNVTPVSMHDAMDDAATFDAAMHDALVQLSSDSSDMNVSSEFKAAYDQAGMRFNYQLMQAANDYADNYMHNPAEARDHLVDAFSNAKASYFGQLEAARNTAVEHLSGHHDVAKDTFVNSYNSARDTYGNQLETVKNKLAQL